MYLAGLFIYIFLLTGVLNESYTQDMLNPKWLADLPEDVSNAWEKEHKESVKTYIHEALVEYVGKPLDSLLKYLEFEHSQYCVPSNISSGLATLPLSYIYKYIYLGYQPLENFLTVTRWMERKPMK